MSRGTVPTVALAVFSVAAAAAAAAALLSPQLSSLAIQVAGTAATAPPSPPLAPHLVAGGWQQSVIVLLVGSEPRPPSAAPDSLDRIARAVEGAESSFGRDPLMWRPDPNAAQGPMQVTPAAAFDVGGGDRFDPPENRALGRAYLARMFRRFGDWRDTVLAYNWGVGNVDHWIAAGRPADWLSSGVVRYVDRVLGDGADAASSAPMAPEVLPSAPLEPVDFAPPLREIPAASIGDVHLRREVADNNRRLDTLRAFLDASAPPRPIDGAYIDPTAAWLRSIGIDPPVLASGDAAARERLRRAGAELVFAIGRAVAKHPDYAIFAQARPTGRLPPPSLDAIRSIASVLAQQFADADATLALIDAHAHQLNARRASPTAPRTRLVRG